MLQHAELTVSLYGSEDALAKLRTLLPDSRFAAEGRAAAKPYVEPLLFAVPKDCEEYIEAKRLLKFLSYFLPVPADDVPRTSLLREFIGGGCYPG